MKQPVIIIDAKRSPIGSFLGPLSAASALELATQCVTTLLSTYTNEKNNCDAIFFGNVLSAGLGQNIARQVGIKAGIKQETPAISINQVCGSGMQSIICGVKDILTDNSAVVLTGGTESMSNAPHILKTIRSGKKLGQTHCEDSIILDGLTDVFSQSHMGLTAETVAEKHNITRQSQDSYATQSQSKASSAQKQGKFTEEITPITIQTRKGETLIDQDDFIKPNTSTETLKVLKPAFKKDGTVTAGNASGINDGAAAVLLCSEEYASKNNTPVLAKILDTNTIGYDPSIMGIAPINAIKILLKKNNLTINDIDLFEINEAFAATSLVVQNELNIPDEKINVNGGAIALGHPIGASAARIVVTLCHELKRQQLSLGIAAVCIGGGQATALLISRS